MAEFKNLQRLDLGFNGLTTLEDLRPCSNLKWLSVVQNQLESLKGVESLSKLTVSLFEFLFGLKLMREWKFVPLLFLRAVPIDPNLLYRHSDQIEILPVEMYVGRFIVLPHLQSVALQLMTLAYRTALTSRECLHRFM